jgi:flagellar motility protein MotE (MotC chaperone)
MGITRLADAVGVSVATVRRALGEAQDAAGRDALEVHGEMRGRGFVARRASTSKGSRWTFSVETPPQMVREATATPPTTDTRYLEATIAQLREALRSAERQADTEHDGRLRLEGEVEALRNECDRLVELLAGAPSGTAAVTMGPDG